MNGHPPALNSDVVPERLEKKPPAGLLVRSLLIWLLLYAVSISIYNRTYHVTSEIMIRHFQVLPAISILRYTLPGVVLHSTPLSIRSPTLELQIQRGCDGIEAWLLLVTALLVFPVPWRKRLAGVLWGTLLIFAVNIVRIVSLFHIALRHPEWMEIAHGFVWQCLIILVAIAFIMIWMDFRFNPKTNPQGRDE